MDRDRKNVLDVRDRQTDRHTDRQRELESEGVIGRRIVPLGKERNNEL